MEMKMMITEMEDIQRQQPAVIERVANGSGS
jgi:hypothetical protein